MGSLPRDDGQVVGVERGQNQQVGNLLTVTVRGGEEDGQGTHVIIEGRAAQRFGRDVECQPGGEWGAVLLHGRQRQHVVGIFIDECGGRDCQGKRPIFRCGEGSDGLRQHRGRVVVEHGE